MNSDTYENLGILSGTEIQTLRVIHKLEQSHGKAVTHDVADSIGLSYHQTLRYLTRLAAEGHIERIGKRGGWRSAA